MHGDTYRIGSGEPECTVVVHRDKLAIDCIDYRDLPDKKMKFDRIVSVDMMEHVGRDNYQLYFGTANALLKDKGVFLLHSITGNDEEMSDSFVRMWDLYLAGCAAAFYIGYLDIHQVLMTKGANNELPMTRWY